jgi:hypothetical protein
MRCYRQAATVCAPMSGRPQEARPRDLQRSHFIGLCASLRMNFNRPRYKGLVSEDPSDTPRQEQQVGRFLSILEERRAWRSYLSTHGQPTR